MVTSAGAWGTICCWASYNNCCFWWITYWYVSKTWGSIDVGGAIFWGLDIYDLCSWLVMSLLVWEVALVATIFCSLSTIKAILSFISWRNSISPLILSILLEQSWFASNSTRGLRSKYLLNDDSVVPIDKGCSLSGLSPHLNFLNHQRLMLWYLSLVFPISSVCTCRAFCLHHYELNAEKETNWLEWWPRP